MREVQKDGIEDGVKLGPLDGIIDIEGEVDGFKDGT